MDPLGFPGGSDGKESACNTGDPGSIPGSGRSPIEGNGYPLQYSCLENPMERRAWWAMVHDLQSWKTLSEQLTLSNGLSSCGSRLLAHRGSVVVECTLSCSGESGLLVPHQ